jgi:hypothetical protein
VDWRVFVTILLWSTAGYDLIGACAGWGLCELERKAVDPRLESARFQPLNCMPDLSGLYLG